MDTENVIYHLTPAEYFNTLPADKPYLPREYDRDGFIHCSKGEERLLLVADTIYRRVPGDFLLLVIDERKVTSPVKYENVGGILFPHIYGALNREAIARVISIGRRADGTFLPIGEPDPAAEQAAKTQAAFSELQVNQLLTGSAELRAQTAGRILQIESDIHALKVALTAAPTQPAAAGPVAQAAAPELELKTRLAQIEQEMTRIKSQLARIEARQRTSHTRHRLAPRSNR
jgi:uncharacterized protein (DUF952 family)